jgi:sec-independent protein translocase protein TatB
MRVRQRGFFDFSFPELVITFGVALVVLGPKKLPGLVQQVGRWVGRARHMARQFREQLETEVNSINAVKPVPRHVPPEVGPTAPAAPPAPEAPIEPHTESHAAGGGTEATGVVDGSPSEPAGPAPVPEAPVEQTHPEAQIYFAMNGSEPAVVAHDPYVTQPAGDDPQAMADPAATTPGETAEGVIPAPAAAAKVVDPNQPATVEVIFPHDHG